MCVCVCVCVPGEMVSWNNSSYMALYTSLFISRIFRPNELATESEQRNDTSRLVCHNARPPSSKTSCGLWCLVHYRSMHAGVRGNNRRDRLTGKKKPSRVTCVSKIFCVEELEALPVGTNPSVRTSRHRSPGGERHRKGNGRRSTLKGLDRVVVTQTNIETVAKAIFGTSTLFRKQYWKNKLLGDECGAYMGAFQSA